ncbi:MAG: hypothetical protein QOI05_5170 [Bradyrhizobium sp.]|nr:hypothetical protein [Bradyrhizobium sp.]
MPVYPAIGRLLRKATSATILKAALACNPTMCWTLRARADMAATKSDRANIA